MNFLNHKCKIYRSNEAAIEFLITNNIISREKECECGRIKEIKVVRRQNNTENIVYQCKSSSCRKVVSLYKDTIFYNTKIPLYDIFTLLNHYIFNNTNYYITYVTDYSEATYISIKKKFLMLVKELNSIDKIGGWNRRVQVDETVISRLGIIDCPSHASDNIYRSVWLVGGIEEDDRNYFFLEIVPDRTIETIKNLFQRKLASGTTVVTDGYPSYPAAVRSLQMEHIIVNHSEGFTNAEGDHTNLIENLWSHLKTEMRTRHGIMHSNWEHYLAEFTWRKRHLMNKQLDSYQEQFLNILRKIWN